MKLEMIKCPKCGNDFPKKRKELGYHVCVNCSTVEPVVGITTLEGTGDHTYNDLIIMDQSRARAIRQKEAELTGKRIHIEVLDFDREDEQELNTAAIVSDKLKELEEPDLDEEETQDEQEEVEERGFEGIDY